MKIAIASEKKDKNSNIDERAGRANYYLIIDESGKLLETISNPFSTGGGGAGFGVAKMLADKKVDIIIAGKFGENMTQGMIERGLKPIEKTGSIDNFISNTLKELI